MDSVTFETARRLPPGRPAYTWRPLDYADLPALRRMMALVTRVDGRMPPDPLADMQHQFHDPSSAPETDTLAAMTPEGEVAAVGRSFVNPNPETECRAYGWGEVHPEHREKGLEPVVLDWLETRGRQRLQSMPAPLPRELRFGALDTRTDWITAVEARGYHPVRSTYRMRRDLAAPIAECPLPEGQTLTTYRPEFDEPVRLALNEAFRDHWSFEPLSVEEWRLYFIDHSGWRPDLVFLALDGAEIAGLCVNLINAEGNQMQGFDEGWVTAVGVRRAWRKRGVASALLCQSMRALKAAGMNYAGLTVDTENPTGALRIYQTQGFAVFKRFVTFAKALTVPD